jgi:transcription factor IIIB subunit 2
LLRLICFGAIQSRLAGSILTSIESGYSMSHQRTLDKGMNFRHLLILLIVLLHELIFILYFTGKDEISQIVNNLHVSGGDTIIKRALHFYEVYISVISQ